jgi:hypothetical protein
MKNHGQTKANNSSGLANTMKVILDSNFSKACLVLLASFIFLTFPSAPAQAMDPFVYDKNTDTLTHINSGFVFPFKVADFEGGEDVKQYNPYGTDVSVPYNLIREGFFVAATVYIYAAPAPAPGRTAGDVLNEHFEGLKTEILATYKGSLSSEDKITLNGLAGRKALFRIELKGDTESELYLFIHKGWFIKYRISYPAKSAILARQEVSKFINALNLIAKN